MKCAFRVAVNSILMLLAIATVSSAFGAYGQASKSAKKPEPISSISLMFDPGMVHHPVWRAISLRGDGTGTSWIRGAEGNGTFKLKGLKPEFDKIARMIEGAHYLKFESYYGPAATDIPILSVSVVFGKTRKSIVDWGKPFQLKYEKEAPQNLKKIEQALLELCFSLRWEKVSSKVDFPDFMPSTDSKG